MVDWQVEREWTYDVAPAEAPAVHRALAPPHGPLLLRDEAVRVRPRSAGLVLHVYTQDRWDERRRVLIELTGHRRIRISEKRWAEADGHPVKLDRRRRISTAEAWRELAGRWRVGFVKARYPIELDLPDDEVLLARIDVMVPIGGGGELQPDRLFAHVELEARTPGADPGLIESDPLLWAELGTRLVPLTRPKFDVAATGEPPPAWSAAETAAHVDAIATAAADLTARSPLAELTALHTAARQHA